MTEVWLRACLALRDHYSCTGVEKLMTIGILEGSLGELAATKGNLSLLCLLPNAIACFLHEGNLL